MNPRLTSTAGRAFLNGEPTEHYIDLSCYLSEKYPVDMQEDTIPHELAHIIAWRLFQEPRHGAAWKQTAIRLYGNCNRTHQYETLNAAQRKASQAAWKQ
jgi:predicted SprT family Zn-dependent metalloprotease